MREFDIGPATIITLVVCAALVGCDWDASGNDVDHTMIVSEDAECKRKGNVMICREPRGWKQ